MGNSLIQYQNKSIWIHDFYLEPIIFFVLKALIVKMEKNRIDKDHLQWFKNYTVELNNLFFGASVGALDFNFHDLSKSSYRLNIIKGHPNYIILSIELNKY